MFQSFIMSNKFAEKRAKDIIGEEGWKEMTNAASGGRIIAEQMKDVVWSLPTDKKNKLGGNHDRRMKEKGTSADETEMKNILADWFHYGEMPQDRVGALEVLIKVFEENGNKPLAKELKKIKDNPDQVQSFHLDFEIIFTYCLCINIGPILQRPVTQPIDSSSPSWRSHNSRKRGKGYRESNCEEVY